MEDFKLQGSSCHRTQVSGDPRRQIVVFLPYFVLTTLTHVITDPFFYCECQWSEVAPATVVTHQPITT